MYNWNKDCRMHEIYETYSANFIRDDERFVNSRFHKDIEKKVNRPFPYCLKSICFYLCTREDALEIANELYIFFPDDIQLTYFAKWLKRTASVCSTYELCC